MQRRAEVDDVVLVADEQLRAVGDAELVEGVDRARFECGDHRGLGRIEGPLDFRRKSRGSPVVRAACEYGTDVRCVARHLEVPRPDELGLELRVVVALRDHDHVVVVRRNGVGERAVSGLEVKSDRLVVHLDDAGGRQGSREHREGVTAVLLFGLRLEAVDDVIDGHRRAVVELHALADLERPHRPVRIRAPTCRQPRLVLELIICEDEVFSDVSKELQSALVIDRERVDGAGRREDPGANRRARSCAWSRRPMDG